MKLVRLNLTEEEYENVYDQALEKGIGSIQEYLRFLLFDEQSQEINYDDLLEQFEKAVVKIPSDKEFRVKDCFDPEVWKDIKTINRRVLGRMVIRKALKGGWLPIVPTRKDSANAQWYRKVSR
ncbi:single-stranded DNA-binding protein [Metabacillus litoralis]|uniref:DUF1413 domain-containing protein n=1 Tax=Metabacillus litoralis TaxID=152268 RepID=UPI001B9B74DC|nr:DUF1413 domain-containing protein [Metabacillus litoralis]MCM3162718.1 single-stranded DNA-binding protein [Metabacillus litoralis]UHA60651.1 single-stranded DNA-binding protein [Metabacillus litoralis]